MKDLNPLYWVATLFFLGRIPHLGSIIGTVLALPAAWAILHYWGHMGLMLATIAVFFIGWLASALYLKTAAGAEDINIDEVVGMWLVLVLANKFNYALDFEVYTAAFLAFCIFDIWKPWPIGSIDEQLGGGLGVMLDDVVAGVYAFGGMVAMLFFYHALGS